MARFRLLQPHDLNTINGPGRFEAGTEIESSAHPSFSCSVFMEPLDLAAAAMLKVECDRLRKEAKSTNSGVAIGFGPIQNLPF
jgi:hypothetical protein